MNATLKLFSYEIGTGEFPPLTALGDYLFRTDTGRASAALPYLLLLACPRLYFAGHDRGHKQNTEADWNDA